MAAQPISTPGKSPVCGEPIMESRSSYHTEDRRHNHTLHCLYGFAARRNLLSPMLKSRLRRLLVTIAGFFSQAESSSSGSYSYNICNGLSNQLLYHSASIALAIEQRIDVQIPNYFIVNGAQTTNENILPSPSNSLPFGDVFDALYFIQTIQTFGIRATFVDFDFEQKQITCAGMESLYRANPIIVFQILQGFRPSPSLQTIIQSITNNTQGFKPKNGICLHHRDGPDWHAHCQRWSSISDGVYRGNCMEVPGYTLLESLQIRGLNDSQWVYYCGDRLEVPTELKDRSSKPVKLHSDFMSYNDTVRLNNMNRDSFVRDMWAVIDFFVCSQFEKFVGNSVSTFSAIQIALRKSENAYWYNTQSIPLANIWNVFQIPIVYTYTELSAQMGKLLLQASICSVRRHIPTCSIHILYHGDKDQDFLNWLKDRNVIIHKYNDPSWKPTIEQMRMSGNRASSHLFQHEGNYFGTWQRVDIPLFINTEYCLLLDSDTLVLRPFTLADFGLNMTLGIAMSAEFNADSVPLNAGVMLMNVPKLRQTYGSFSNFIRAHAKNATFKSSAPSDQGAYLEFYESDLRFLDREFNFKPYWKETAVRKDPFILHFHGAKPHDYIKSIMGESCDSATNFICVQAPSLPFLCRALQLFANEIMSTDQIAYCNVAFQNPGGERFCYELLHMLAKKNDACNNFPGVILSVLDKIPADELGIPKKVIAQKFQSTIKLRLLCLFIVVSVFAAAKRCRFKLFGFHFKNN